MITLPQIYSTINKWCSRLQIDESTFMRMIQPNEFQENRFFVILKDGSLMEPVMEDRNSFKAFTSTQDFSSCVGYNDSVMPLWKWLSLTLPSGFN